MTRFVKKFTIIVGVIFALPFVIVIPIVMDSVFWMGPRADTAREQLEKSFVVGATSSEVIAKATGLGADDVLVVKRNTPEMQIFIRFKRDYGGLSHQICDIPFKDDKATSIKCVFSG